MEGAYKCNGDKHIHGIWGEWRDMNKGTGTD